MCTAPDFLGTTTIPAHQGVGSSTGVMTPSDYMLESSSFTFCRRGNSTFLGVYRANGCASGFRQISYGSPFQVPRPVNCSLGNCSGMDCVTAFTCLSTCTAQIAGKPSRFCLTFLTTKMGCVHSVPLYTNLTVASPVTSNGQLSGP